jgi:hypothetical protein
MMLTYSSQSWAFFSPFTRAWEFGAGALVAMALGVRWLIAPAVSGVIAYTGLAAVLIAAFIFTSSTPFPGFAALLPVLGTMAILISAPHAPAWGPASLLQLRPLRFIGRISYAIYLVHWPLLVLPPLIDPTGEPLNLVGSLVLGVLSIPAAWLLHRLVERPFLDTRWARRLTPRAVLLATTGAMVVVLVVTLGLAYTSAQRPLSSSVEEGAVMPGSSDVIFSPAVPANLRPSLAEAASDLPAVYADGCHLSPGADDPADCLYGDRDAPLEVILFGDSHTAQWFPAMMTTIDPQLMSLRMHTKSSCPAIEITIVTYGVADTGCNTWREAVIRSIEASPPDAVIISSFAHYEEYGASGVTLSTWSVGVEATVTRLQEVTQVVVISDTPRFERSPSGCLSASVLNASRCALPPDEALDLAWANAERRVAEANGAIVIEFNSLLCNSTMCGVIIGDVLLYRDEHHLTATMSASLGPALASELAKKIPKTFGNVPTTGKN